MSFELDSCCLCVGLRTGSLIIGYIRLILSLIAPISMIFGIELVYQALGLDMETDKTTKGVLIAVLCIIMAILLVNVIFNILLLVGLHKNKRGYVRAYIVFSIFLIIGSCLKHASGLDSGSKTESATKFLVDILFQLYLLFVIRSHYLKMEEPDQNLLIVSKA